MAFIKNFFLVCWLDTDHSLTIDLEDIWGNSVRLPAVILSPGSSSSTAKQILTSYALANNLLDHFLDNKVNLLDLVKSFIP